ncbi:MAG TPA: hypothetical protein VGM88_18460 [Kofleriaceae bacterium]|jgi:hypothetical protein
MTAGEARALLARHTVFAKPDADALWAALLALDDAAEFVREAKRLRWEFHPRGSTNTELHERYGDGILPWLATRVQGGVLTDMPWCIAPLLLACGSPDAAALAWTVTETRSNWGRGDVRTAWFDAHPAVGAAYLTTLEDARAWAQLAAMRARKAVDGPLEVLPLLDACALGLVAPELSLWPTERGTGPRTTHGSRAIAVRDGADWGLAIETLEGDRAGGIYRARIAILALGTRVGARYRGVRQLQRTLDVTDAPREAGEPFAAWLRARGDAAWGTFDPALVGLPAGSIVATIPSLAHGEPGSRPSDAGVFQALARALS